MKKKSKKIETIYYKDPLNDDFAGTKIKRRELPENFKWMHTNPIWHFFSRAIYYAIAYPVIFLTAKIGYGVKVVGLRKLRNAKLKGGYFLFGNHTLISDAFAPQIFMTRSRFAHMVADQDAVSIPGIKGLLMMLGVLPVPENPEQHRKFSEAIEYYAMKKGRVIVVYPEAHIWPYYTSIRPFTEKSYVMPAKLGLPVVSFAATFKKRKFRKHPRIIYHVSDPIYPDMSLSLNERAKELRDASYEFMIDTVSSLDNLTTIRYIRIKDEEKKND